MMPEIELGLFIGTQIFTAGAIYGAIRADIKAIHANLGDLKESVKTAHQRLDQHLEHARKTEK